MRHLCSLLLLGLWAVSSLQAQAQDLQLSPRKERACRVYWDLLYGYTLYGLHREVYGANPVRRHTGQDYGTRLRFQYSLPFYRQVYLGATAAYRLRAVDMWVNKPIAQGPGGQRIVQHRTQHYNLDGVLGYRHPLPGRWTWQTEFSFGVEVGAPVRNRFQKSFFGVGKTDCYPFELLYYASPPPSPPGSQYIVTYYRVFHEFDNRPLFAWSLGTGLEYRLPNSRRLYLGLSYRQFTDTRFENYDVIQDPLRYPMSVSSDELAYYYTGPLSTLFLHLGIGF